jgi:dihydrofolate reductase
MRKLIYAINGTLDGCFGHADGIAPDEECMEYHMDLMRGVDTLLFGRKTYQLMVPYWPDTLKDSSDRKEDHEFAREFVAKKLVMFSRTLDSVEDKNTKIVRGNLRDEILKLKQEPGKDILVGGVDVASQLIELGLVDEYRFMILPVLAGAGRRLLEGVHLREKLRLKLVESKIFKASGFVALHYLKP